MAEMDVAWMQIICSLRRLQICNISKNKCFRGATSRCKRHTCLPVGVIWLTPDGASHRDIQCFNHAVAMFFYQLMRLLVITWVQCALGNIVPRLSAHTICYMLCQQ